MALKSFDIPESTEGRAHDIAALGYKAVGLYLRSDRASLAMIKGLHTVGIKVWSTWEKGNPTAEGYFSAGKGTEDAEAAVACASAWGQPQASPIFFCVDYDAATAHITGPIHAYMTAAHAVCDAKGYRVGVYGSGATCMAMIQAGVAHVGWLAGSKGFSGYQKFHGQAAIVQGNEDAKVLDFAVDLDTVNDETVCW